MRVDSSQSSYYSSSLFGQSATSSDDDTPFALPDDDSEQTPTASVSSAGVSTTSAVNSISSAFWQNQSASADEATAGIAGGDTLEGSTSGDLSSDDLLSEFAKWANMSPADRIRAQYLEQQNLTEDQFSKLSSDQQAAINDQIAAQIKQQTGAGETDAEGDSGAVSLG